MNLVKNIRENFATLLMGNYSVIRELDPEYIGYTLYLPEGYAVAIEFDSDLNINEKFSNSKLFSRKLNLDGTLKKYLILLCTLDNLRYEFAALSAQFLDPGENGDYRKRIIEDPLSWWKQWIELLGNSISIKKAYSVIAEMIALDYLFQKDNTIEWTAINTGSHDLEGDTCSYEVKSSLKKYSAEITISSQYQLRSKKSMYLMFIKLEKSQLGVSIDDMKNRLISHGYDGDKLENQIQRLGFENGASVRKEKYKILEKRQYFVDDKFPKITNESFIGGKLPDSITKITYTINLDGIEYINW